ncbi:MAG: AAA family ATPase [Chloroflexi bacterium]|nr:AAA family ATPase [Chloroflexota bacterium]
MNNVETSGQTTFDPWTKVRTIHDLAADEVISALQKEIRRGQTENAALLAHEMILSSPALEDKLWERLLIISVEDVGLGNSFAAVLTEALFRIYQSLPAGGGDRRIVAIHAVRYLCRAQKDRSSADMASWIYKAVASGETLPVIPDYALDMHTAAGARMGRGLTHFYEVASQVSPESEEVDKTYRARLVALLSDKSRSDTPKE